MAYGKMALIVQSLICGADNSVAKLIRHQSYVYLALLNIFKSRFLLVYQNDRFSL